MKPLDATNERRRLSDLAFERYEAEYDRALYMEKATEMLGSEHQRVARRAAYELVMNECSTVSETVSPQDYEEVLADHRRLVREIDAIINGEAGAAKQASLCDLIPQIKQLVGKWDKAGDRCPQCGTGIAFAATRSATLTPKGETPRTDTIMSGADCAEILAGRLCALARQLERELAAFDRRCARLEDQLTLPSAKLSPEVTAQATREEAARYRWLVDHHYGECLAEHFGSNALLLDALLDEEMKRGELYVSETKK